MRRRALAAVILALACLAAIPKPPLREGLSFSQAVRDRRDRLLRLSLSSDAKYRLWLPLEDISPKLVEATLAQEDRHFRRHPGVNPVSLVRAAWQTYVRRERRVGGSTITMQLARIRYRLRTRTIPGKLLQILKALQIERHYTKDRILEAYLNLAPYGGNVEGVGAASLIYFGKDASRLTLSEAVTLGVVPQDPVSRTPDAKKGAESELGRAGRKLWIALKGKRAPPPDLPAEPDGVPLPFRAPHFVEAVLRQDVRRSDTIRTTLDLGMQELVERQVRGYVEAKRRMGIRNAAVLLLDHRSMDVLAAMGSADYFDPEIQGQVNGLRALRSPGSALKPFVYALGMDQGLIHPLSVLKDAPSSFGGFDPENFDGDFEGPIRVEEALVRSRNVPAVQVASELRDPDFYDFLKRAGVPLPRGREHYGLAPVLGGAEVTVEHMARLYAMLANKGLLRPLNTRLDGEPAEGREMLSQESCFLVLDILKEVPRPGRGFKAEWTADAMPIHWKTGTSYAFRDAWSVGVFGQYVLAVWVGNFDGEGNPSLVGTEAAAPLFFRIADALRPHARDQGLADHHRLGDMVRVAVCPVSGRLPGKHCPRTARTWFIPGKSPIKRCEVHRLIFVDTTTGRRVCRPGSKPAEPRVYEYWSTDLLKIFRQAGIPRRLPPKEGPDCGMAARYASGIAPKITSPDSAVVYSVRVSSAGKQAVPLAAVADADVRELYWFSDDRFLGSVPAGETLFWKPNPGRTLVRVLDDHGRSDARNLEITVVR